MLKEIQELFNDQIIYEAAKLYSATADQLKSIGGFESHVFEFERAGHSYILKITHTIRRTLNYLIGEIEFVNYLAENNVSVSKAVKSVNGRFVEEINAEKGSFLTYVFEKAPGVLIKKDELDGEKLFKWGELTAGINLHSQNFQASNILYQRNHWLVDLKSYFDRFVLKSEIKIREKAFVLMEKIDRIPKNKDNFGLTHSDLSYFNLVYHKGKLTAFDFDECSYQYFVYDIALALYYSRLYSNRLGMNEKEYIEFFKMHFLGGYKTILDVPDACLRNVPDFLRLRNYVQYAADCQYFGTENVSERGKQIMDNKKRLIFEDGWANLGFE
jgi:amicoumacin kinase